MDGIISPFGGFDPDSSRVCANARRRIENNYWHERDFPNNGNYEEKFWHSLLEEMYRGYAEESESARATFLAYVKGPRHFLPKSILRELERLNETEILDAYERAHRDY